MNIKVISELEIERCKGLWNILKFWHAIQPFQEFTDAYYVIILTKCPGLIMDNINGV